MHLTDNDDVQGFNVHLKANSEHSDSTHLYLTQLKKKLKIAQFLPVAKF